MNRWIRRYAAVAAMSLATACGHGTTTPTQQPLTLTCPADIRIGSVAGPTENVNYPLPTANGATGVATSCNPAPNSAFPLGETTVNCTGTSGSRTGTCSFKVTLVPPQPVLQVNHLIGFGDSITAGENGELTAGQNSPLFIDVKNSWPSLMRELLTSRYTTQTPVVNNCGIPGEKMEEGAARVDAVFDFFKPDVFMLMEGVNNLTGNLSSDLDTITFGLRHDLISARSHGLPGIFVSTILPMNPQGFRAHDVGEVVPANDTIRNQAAQLGAVLVDSYAAFVGHPEYLDTDGLHPLPIGNQVIAQQFFNAVQTKFEILQPTGRYAPFFTPPSPFATTPLCPNDDSPTVAGQSLHR